jgi:predicted XRE-type DNA-binding protein
MTVEGGVASEDSVVREAAWVRARDLERVFVSRIQQPRVSEMMRGKPSTLSVARLLLYADLVGAEADVKLRKARAHAVA